MDWFKQTYLDFSSFPRSFYVIGNSLGSIKNNFPFDHLAIIMTEDVW